RGVEALAARCGGAVGARRRRQRAEGLALRRGDGRDRGLARRRRASGRFPRSSRRDLRAALELQGHSNTALGARGHRRDLATALNRGRPAARRPLAESKTQREDAPASAASRLAASTDAPTTRSTGARCSGVTATAGAEMTPITSLGQAKRAPCASRADVGRAAIRSITRLSAPRIAGL